MIASFLFYVFIFIILLLIISTISFLCIKTTHISTGHSFYVKINGILSQILYYESKNSQSSKKKYIFVNITGNPGHIEFYDKFLKRILENFQNEVDVYGISLNGHFNITIFDYLRKKGILIWKRLFQRSLAKLSQISFGDVLRHGLISAKTYNLAEQIENKLDFIKIIMENNPDSQIILAGHSVGGYIVLRLLDKLPKNKVNLTFFLFPTIEHIRKTPNGDIHINILNSRITQHILQSAAFFIGNLPEFVKKGFIRFFYRENDIIQTISDLVSFNVMRNCLELSHYEFELIKNLDEEAIKRHMDKIVLYYGVEDMWVPHEFYEKNIKLFPNANIYLDDKKLLHAFVIEGAIPMADEIYKLTKKLGKN